MRGFLLPFSLTKEVGDVTVQRHPCFNCGKARSKNVHVIVKKNEISGNQK